MAGFDEPGAEAVFPGAQYRGDGEIGVELVAAQPADEGQDVSWAGGRDQGQVGRVQGADGVAALSGAQFLVLGGARPGNG